MLGAYYGREMVRAEQEGRIRKVAVDPDLPVHCAWDLGVGDDTAIWFFQVSGAQIHVVDFYQNSGYAVGHYANVKRDKGYRYGSDYVPHDARQREFLTGDKDGLARQRLEVMLDHGLQPVLVPVSCVQMATAFV